MTFSHKLSMGNIGTLIAIAAIFMIHSATANAATNLLPSDDGALVNSQPPGYHNDGGGSNASKPSVVAGHTGANALRMDLTATGGGADWYPDPVTVTSGATYTFSVSYMANVDTDVGAEQYSSTGADLGYLWVGTASSANCNTTWCTGKWTVTVPAGVAKMTLFLGISKVGYVTVDDYSLTVGGAPSTWTKGIVSVSTDDGWGSEFTNGRPIWNSLKIPVTWYLTSSFLGDTADGYMTKANAITVAHENSNEIGNHTVDHPDLTGLTANAAAKEFSDSQTALKAITGVTPTTCAYPFGAHNPATALPPPDGGTLVVDPIAAKYFVGCRTTEGGWDYPQDFTTSLSWYDLKDYNVDANTSTAAVCQAITDTSTYGGHLNIVYHEVGANLGGDVYHTSTADLRTEMNCLTSARSAGKVVVMTEAAAITTMKAQLTAAGS